MKIDYSRLIPIDTIEGEDPEETEQLHGLYVRAEDFIESFKWCAKINKAYFGIGAADIIAVFLFEIVPTSKNIDPLLWVIVGDIPPAYLVTDGAPNPACALDSYIGEMNKWVDAVLAGESISDLIPVNAPPTTENANGLKKRLEFLDKEILSGYSNDLRLP